MQDRNVDKSMKLYERACQLIPGGTQLISRRPTRFACGVSPVYAQRASGSRFWDIDGNEYIDWVSGIGAIILGYCDPVVDDAVREQISTGTMYSINHELEVELAEELVNTIPCAEMVRYAKGGGDACAIAVRIARGASGRDKILFSGYHGWHDWYLAANLDTGADQKNASLDSHLFPGIDPTGVPKCLAGTAIPFPYGDLDALGNALDDHHGEIAAVIMEPFRSELPPDGYLEGVAKLARAQDVILIFDEVSTGFRPTASGAQPLVGVTPDMAVFAKSISNGYPMGAVVGRRDVMEAASQMFISSTYWSDTLGLRAALTTLQEVRRRDVPKIVHDIGTTLQSQITSVANETGVSARCEGLSFHPHLTFETDNEVERSQLATLFIQEMAKRGCHGYTSFYLNAAQTSDDIEQTVTAALATFQIIAQGLEKGNLGELLECQQQVESFRRLVR
ncbi:MAG: aminotransferase class III-fold pyridoxal phosphate-dependent enzyme [Planctomycetes bacterium]|nr:aminotransferase class III-fold pyridoxal phosphate-dependent enzyme [Planctomycetota bacterium]